jgi:hypothetical protein
LLGILLLEIEDVSGVSKIKQGVVRDLHGCGLILNDCFDSIEGKSQYYLLLPVA